MATIDTTTEKVKKVNGGARPGAGRKAGGMNAKTVERLAVKQAFIDRVYQHADELFELQMANARKGDGKAIESLLDRAFGKSQENLDLTTNGKELGVTPERAEQLLRARANRSNP